MGTVEKLKSRFNTTFRGPVRREQWAWAMFDWAKSPYENAVLGVFLGPFITALAKQHASVFGVLLWGHAGAYLELVNPASIVLQPVIGAVMKKGYVYIGDSEISYGSLYAYAIAASAVIQVIVLPFVGAFGDSTNKPKFYLSVVTILSCILLVLMLSVTRPSLFWLATLFSILGNVLYAMVNVFYNALLVFIASPKEQNNVSALGYAIGYIGGGVVLVISLISYLAAPTYLTIRIMMAVSGAWWMLFSLITFKRVISNSPRVDEVDETTPIPSSIAESSSSVKSSVSDSMNRELNPAIDTLPALSSIATTSMHEGENGNILKRTFTQLWSTIVLLRAIPVTGFFLIASAIYNDGISSVNSLAGTYATEALDASFSTLAVLALVTNFAGIVGAFSFTWLATKIGTKFSILISLLLFIALIYAYFVKTISQLYVIGFLLGIGIGSSQPLSRSLLASMIPKGYENQIFSFYELTQRGTSWIGPLVYASVTDKYLFFTSLLFYFSLMLIKYKNNPRPGILALVAFFVVGGFLLFFVNTEKGIRQAKAIEERQKSKA